MFRKQNETPAKPGLAARKLAVACLVAVLREKRALDDSFNRLALAEPNAGLAERDRAFARAIALTALRRSGQIREVLAHFIARPPAAPKGDLDEILLAASAQLLFLRAAPHAVIDLTVDQIKQDRAAARFSKLANAVLRRLAEDGPALLATQDAARLNTPAWLFASWQAAYGEEIAQRIALAHLNEAPLDLTVKSSPQTWAERLNGVVLAGGTVRLRSEGRIEDLPGFCEGEWWVQDVAAALPARLLGNVRGKAIADLCAAPGGKTAQLAHAGAEVIAVEVSRQRLGRLEDNLKRLRLHANIVVADAATWQPDAPLDGVLLDAPCTATGTIRRNPDIAHLKSPADIETLSGLQFRLIDNAVRMLKPGGILVYCTCSLQPEEGHEQIERLMGAGAPLRVEPIRPEEIGGHGEWLTHEGFLRTLPCHLQLSEPGLSCMDGFFAARLVKI